VAFTRGGLLREVALGRLVVKREYIFVCILSKRALKTLESAFLLAWGLLNRGSVKSQPIKKLTSLPAVREHRRLRAALFTPWRRVFFRESQGIK